MPFRWTVERYSDCRSLRVRQVSKGITRRARIVALIAAAKPGESEDRVRAGATLRPSAGAAGHAADWSQTSLASNPGQMASRQRGLNIPRAPTGKPRRSTSTVSIAWRRSQASIANWRLPLIVTRPSSEKTSSVVSAVSEALWSGRSLPMSPNIQFVLRLQAAS